MFFKHLSLIYRVMCTAGVRVDSWPLCRDGLYADRMFAVVSATTGKVLTQKTCPRLALCRPRIDLTSNALTVLAPGMNSPLVVPLTDEDDCEDDDAGNSSCNGDRTVGSSYVPLESGSAEFVTVCNRRTEIAVRTDGRLRRSSSAAADKWFSEYLQERCALVKRRDRSGGHTESVLSSKEKEDTPGNFVNEAQFLMITQRSLHELSQAWTDIAYLQAYTDSFVCFVMFSL